MPAISVEKYLVIAHLYNSAQTQVAGVADYYYDAAYEIVLLQTFDPELDLLSPFYNAYLSANSVYRSAPAATVAAVGALQRHILDKARTNPDVDTSAAAPRRFTDINDWLNCANDDDGNSFGIPVGRQGDVPQSHEVRVRFASMSAQAGFDIDADNIAI